MKRISPLEIRSAEPLEIRADEDNTDPVAAAARAVEELRSANTEFRTAQETAVRGITDRIAALETRLNRPGTQTQENRDEPSDERRAFGTYLRRGRDMPEEELRAMTVSDDTQGGYLAPAEVSNEFIRNLVDFSPIRSVASVRTITSPSVKYPKRTGVSNAQWEGEGEDSEESTVTFGQAEVPANSLRTYVDLSNELLADSGGQAEQEVRLALAEDFGEKEGAAFVNGTGSKQPEGLMVNADIQSYLNGHATDLKPDALIKLMYDLPAAYRNAGSWLMNGTTLGIVRTLKDGDGRFLWQPSFQAGQPATVLGRPVVEAKDMPDIAANAFPILYGDFSAYRIVDRLAMSILVNPYLLATKGLTRIHATRRTGGRVLQAARFRKLKMATA
jgi:HK97 family phage major capsid protein